MQISFLNTSRRAAAAGVGAAIAATVILLALCETAFARQDEKPQAPKGKRGSIARKFKNIKVIGDLPAEQLGPIMLGWNVALGVKCNFCHIEEKTAEGKTVTNYESDSNPMKNAARDMYLLTTNLNAKEKSVANSVTCFMCHQGKVVPIAKAPEKPSGVERSRRSH